MNSKALVPVDDSITTTHTLERIVTLKGRLSEKLTVLHVVDVDRLSYRMIPDFQLEMIRESARKAGAELLASRVKFLEAAGFLVESKLEMGSPRDKIVQVANSGGFDFVLIGRNESTGEIRDLLVGSVVNFVMHKVHCPVLLF